LTAARTGKRRAAGQKRPRVLFFSRQRWVAAKDFGPGQSLDNANSSLTQVESRFVRLAPLQKANLQSAAFYNENGNVPRAIVSQKVF
jgi:hypothetical protein